MTSGGPLHSGGHAQRNGPVARAAVAQPAPAASDLLSSAKERLADLRAGALGGVPDWVVAAVLVLLAALGVFAGVAFGQRLQGPKAEVAPVVEVAPAAAAPVIAPTPAAPPAAAPKPPKGPPAPPRAP